MDTSKLSPDQKQDYRNRLNGWSFDDLLEELDEECQGDRPYGERSAKCAWRIRACKEELSRRFHDDD